jgi:hypothetical protein
LPFLIEHLLANPSKFVFNTRGPSSASKVRPPNDTSDRPNDIPKSIKPVNTAIIAAANGQATSEAFLSNWVALAKNQRVSIVLSYRILLI